MKKQLNIRASEATHEKIMFLKEKYGTKTIVLELAIGLLYAQYVNTMSPTDKPKKAGKKP